MFGASLLSHSLTPGCVNVFVYGCVLNNDVAHGRHTIGSIIRCHCRCKKKRRDPGEPCGSPARISDASQSSSSVLSGAAESAARSAWPTSWLVKMKWFPSSVLLSWILFHGDTVIANVWGWQIGRAGANPRKHHPNFSCRYCNSPFHIYQGAKYFVGFPGGVRGKEPTHQCRWCERHWFDS